MVGALCPPYTAQQGIAIVRKGKCQKEAKHQNKESNGKAKLRR